jgi:hypothetical protein
MTKCRVKLKEIWLVPLVMWVIIMIIALFYFKCPYINVMQFIVNSYKSGNPASGRFTMTLCLSTRPVCVLQFFNFKHYFSSEIPLSVAFSVCKLQRQNVWRRCSTSWSQCATGLLAISKKNLLLAECICNIEAHGIAIYWIWSLLLVAEDMLVTPDEFCKLDRTNSSTCELKCKPYLQRMCWKCIQIHIIRVKFQWCFLHWWEWCNQVCAS